MLATVFFSHRASKVPSSLLELCSSIELSRRLLNLHWHLLRGLFHGSVRLELGHLALHPFQVVGKVSALELFDFEQDPLEQACDQSTVFILGALVLEHTANNLQNRREIVIISCGHCMSGIETTETGLVRSALEPKIPTRRLSARRRASRTSHNDSCTTAAILRTT